MTRLLKFIFLVFVIAISAYFYVLNESKENGVPPEAAKNEFKEKRETSFKSKKSKPISKLDHTPQKIKKPPITQPENQTTESKDSFYSRVAKDRLVPFEVVGDLAIAYGDVILGRLDEYQKNVENISSGFSELPRSRLWPSNYIPYLIDDSVSQKSEIEKAILIFEQETNIRFVSGQNEEDLIVFTIAEQHCFSHLGRMGGPQPIYLSPECDARAISHELMHALGFFHEQSRTDRDQYVDIIWENIQPKYEAQFAKVPFDFMEIIDGFEFDFRSIMLYPANAFSIDGKSQTMESVTRDLIQPTQDYFSKSDVQRINRAYPAY